MEQSNIKELATALAKAQGDLHNPLKDKAGYGYKYADLAQLLDIVRPVFSKHGLSIVQFITTERRENMNYVNVATHLLHESGEELNSLLSLPYIEGKGMNTVQAIGSVSTYGRRYALASLCGIAQSDDDGMQMQQQREQKHTPTSKQPPVQHQALVTQETLSQVLKNYQINAKAFTAHFNIESKQQADALLADRARLEAMITEYANFVNQLN